MDFDYVIKAGSIADGTGTRELFVADIGVTGDRITALGHLGDAQAESVIDARGYVLAPGFIDVHVHSEISLLGGRDQLAGLSQGITTQLLSPDGFGWAPLGPALASEMWRYTHFAYGHR